MQAEDKITVPNPAALIAGVRHAEQDLAHWDQAHWFRGRLTETAVGEIDTEYEPACGTTCCLAGHVLLASGMSWKDIREIDKNDDVARRASDVLGFERNSVEYWDWKSRVWNKTDMDLEKVEDGITWDAHVYLRSGEAQFRLFKKYLTELTGVEL